MNQLGMFPLISLIIFLPLAGAILIAFIPSRFQMFHKQLAFVFSGISFISSLALMIFFNFNSQLVEQARQFRKLHFS